MIPEIILRGTVDRLDAENFTKKSGNTTVWMWIPRGSLSGTVENLSRT
jgi:hypothetical protein